MHAQIQFVIDQLKFRNPGLVRVVLTAGEWTPLGRIMSKVYYQTNICDVVDRDCRSGYPHNGGQHTFEFFGPRGDAVAMIEMIKEEVLCRFNFDEETRRVANELSFVSQEILSHKMK